MPAHFVTAEKPWCHVEWTSNQEKRLLRAGGMAHIPRNTPHATYNSNSVPLKFLAILSPVEAPGEFSVDLIGQEPWCSPRARAN
jgi:uncharacterized RmlC-like cupin family protein